MRRLIGVMSAVCMLMVAGPAFTQMNKSTLKQAFRMLQAAPDPAAVLDSLSHQDFHPDSSQIPVLREALWQYLVSYHGKALPKFREGEENTCTIGGGVEGKFSFKRKGVAPAAGYPVYIALHGGGGGPKEMNDEQWEQMQQYYLQSIDTGIYVAPRGIHDTWNLHFDDEAQAFFNLLLQRLRLLGGVDPNRIYLLGYSAGGDGVYQLAPRFASQLAAANMSAGHHNGVSPVNLQHCPMLLQVGELDEAYERNRETVRYSLLLDSLQKAYPTEYAHQVYVHSQAEHSNVMDRRGPEFEATVLMSPVAWLKTKALQQVTKATTDAPTWVRKFRRNPHPHHLRWDAATRMAGADDYFWISAGQADANQVIEVWADPSQNAVKIAPFKGELRLHLHEALFHPSKPLQLSVDRQVFTIPLKPSMLEMARTIFGAVDSEYCAWQTVRVWSDKKGKFFAE